MSNTQLANYMSAAGILAFLLAQAGIILPQEKIAFILYALWTLGWNVYNFYNRYSKGDISLGGFKKDETLSV